MQAVCVMMCYESWVMMHELWCTWCVVCSISWVVLWDMSYDARECDDSLLITHHNTWHICVTHCNTLQHTATHCNTLQHAATHCNTLITHHNTWHIWCMCFVWWCVMNYDACVMCYNVLCVRTPMSRNDAHTHTCACLMTHISRCNTLQHAATHCNTLQHTLIDDSYMTFVWRGSHVCMTHVWHMHAYTGVCRW